MRLTGPATRVRRDESQEVLVVANYIRILPLTPGPYATKEFNIFFPTISNLSHEPPKRRKRMCNSGKRYIHYGILTRNFDMCLGFGEFCGM